MVVVGRGGAWMAGACRRVGGVVLGVELGVSCWWAKACGLAVQSDGVWPCGPVRGYVVEFDPTFPFVVAPELRTMPARTMALFPAVELVVAPESRRMLFCSLALVAPRALALVPDELAETSATFVAESALGEKLLEVCLRIGRLCCWANSAMGAHVPGEWFKAGRRRHGTNAGMVVHGGDPLRKALRSWRSWSLVGGS